MKNDDYNLQRFMMIQHETYGKAYMELSEGKKQSHWMLWMFPQIKGLDRTPNSQKYAIKNLDEAKAFLQHPYLGRNLRDLCYVLLRLDTNYIPDIFEYPDILQPHSSMTLFLEADPSERVFRRVLDRFYNGRKDQKTLKILKEQR